MGVWGWLVFDGYGVGLISIEYEGELGGDFSGAYGVEVGNWRESWELRGGGGSMGLISSEYEGELGWGFIWGLWGGGGSIGVVGD